MRTRLMLCVLLLASCKPGDAERAQRDFCSDAAYKAVSAACQEGERSAPDIETLEAIRDACHAMVEAQRLACDGRTR